jgi:Domain of unknown function (DUF4349)
MTSADLIAQLRATRPSAGEELRTTVRSLAAGESIAPRARFSGLSLRRLVTVAVPATAIVAVGIAGVAGLARSGGGEVGTSAVEAVRGGALTQDQSTPSASPKAQAGPAGAGRVEVAPAPAGDRAQRYSAQLAIEVADTDALSDATQRALMTTRDLGGYVVSVSYASSDSGTATMTLRVPTAKVQEAIVQLSALGTIVSQNVQIDDLQEQVDALAKREATLRGQIARLSARLAGDLDAATRAALRARRDALRAELATARATSTQVDAAASHATIQLALSTPESSLVPVAPSRFDRALDEAAGILAVEASVLLYAAVILLPPAILAIAIWLGLAAARRRSDERLLSAS